MAAENLFSQYLQPPKSVAEYTAELNKADLSNLQLEGQKGQNALLAVTRQQQIQASQQAQAKLNAIQQIYTTLGPNADPMARAKALQSNPLTAQEGVAAEKALLDSQKTAADTAETQGKTATGAFALRQQKADQAIKDITTFQSPQEAAQSLQQHMQAGDIDPQKGQAMLQGIPQDPQQFAAWQISMLRGIMSAKDRLESQKPIVNNFSTGGAHVTQTLDPVTGKPTGAQTMPMTQSPDNAATNATSRANNAATQAGENLRAGIQPGGGLDDNTERTAQAIAAGQLPAPTGMALLNPKNQRILGRVMEINPNYDFTDIAAKKAAATAFTTGSQGNALRAMSTASDHLDHLNELITGLKNGDAQIVNRATNWFNTQTGQTGATNFQAIAPIVGQEVVKAIIANGGSMAEREEAAKVFSTNKSPEQLAEGIQQLRIVMGAQKKNLLEQRRAAGLKDATLPKYTSDNAGLPSAADIDAEIARRKK